MRITRKKLIQLIKEELAQEVSMEGSLEEAAPEPISPMELCKKIVLLIRTGSPSEDKLVKDLLNAFAAAVGEGEITSQSGVRRGLDTLLKGLQGMTGDDQAQTADVPGSDDFSAQKERSIAPE